MRRVGILTISDRGAGGGYEDKSGPLAAQTIAEQTAWTIERTGIIPDEFDAITRTLSSGARAEVAAFTYERMADAFESAVEFGIRHTSTRRNVAVV